jgi:hypothetical protein
MVEVSGPCIVLGIPNLGFLKAMDESEVEFRGYIISEPCDSVARKGD